MSRYGDRIGMTVTQGGVNVSSSVERVRTRHGYDMRICEAEGDFPLSLAYPGGYETLVVQAGLTSEGSDTYGPSTTRFSGIVTNTNVQHWPYTFKPQGRGWLSIADKLVAPDDTWANALAVGPIFDLKFLPPGIDMTNNGLGQTDTQQIISILGTCGLTGKIQNNPSDIGGLSYLLGTQVRAFEQFVWRRGQSALSYIESLDAMFGFRTWEGPDGFIHRTLTSSFAPFANHALDDRYTLNENRDVLEGASIVRDIGNIRNRVVVKGWDPGDGTNVWASVGGASPLPPGVSVLSETFTSPLIERLQASDLGDGLSSQEAANYWLGQLQYPMLEAVVPTWKDTPYQPGDLVYCNCPHLLGVNQSMWVKHVECEITSSTFTQTLTLRAQDFATFRGPPVLPLSLGAQLQQGP